MYEEKGDSKPVSRKRLGKKWPQKKKRGGGDTIKQTKGTKICVEIRG